MPLYRVFRVFLLSLVMIGLSVCEASAAQSASLEQVRQSIENSAANTEDPAHAMAFRHAAGAIATASNALNGQPPDQDAAAKALKEALMWLVEAANRGSDVGAIVEQLGPVLVSSGALSERGLRDLRALLEILRQAQMTRATTERATLEQDMAIRELIVALHNLIDNGWHDIWHSLDALKWYINASGSGVYLRDLVARLLDYWILQGDISAEAAARIRAAMEELARKAAAGEASSREIVDEIRRIKEIISMETRRVAQERHEREREEAEREAAGNAEADFPALEPEEPTVYIDDRYYPPFDEPIAPAAPPPAPPPPPPPPPPPVTGGPPPPTIPF